MAKNWLGEFLLISHLDCVYLHKRVFNKNTIKTNNNKTVKTICQKKQPHLTK